VAEDHLVREMAAFAEIDVRELAEPLSGNSEIRRPSVDPGRMIRRLIVG